MKYLLYCAAALFGLATGSYLNVLIYRIPQGINTAKGRSFCPACGHTLTAADLVPVFSYIFLRGRCRHCGAKISPRYMAVELANAVLYLLYAIKFGLSVTAIGYFIFASSLICVFFIDAEHMMIYDRFNIAIAAAGLMMFFDGGMPWYERIAGFFSVSLIFLVIALASGGAAMGGGDIKLTAAAGLVLGWKNMLLSLFIAALMGAVISGGRYYGAKLRKKEADNVVAFGTYLAAGMIVSSFAGEQITELYFSYLSAI